MSVDQGHTEKGQMQRMKEEETDDWNHRQEYHGAKRG